MRFQEESLKPWEEIKYLFLKMTGFIYAIGCIALSLILTVWDRFIAYRHWCGGRYHPWLRDDCKLCHYPKNPRGKFPVDEAAYEEKCRKEDEEIIKAYLQQLPSHPLQKPE